MNEAMSVGLLRPKRRLYVAVYTLSLAWVLLWPPISALGADLTLITEDFPPFNYVEDGTLKGFGVEIVRAVQDRLGDETPIKVLPWARGYNRTLKNKNTALFLTVRSRERESLFKWVGPIAEMQFGLYALPDRSFSIKTLDDARDFLIGVQRDGFTMQTLKEQGFTKLDPSTYPVANLRKLLGGQNDLWFANSAVASTNLRMLNVADTAITLVFQVSEASLYIAFNKSTPDTVIGPWKNAYRELIQDGSVLRILTSRSLASVYPKIFLR